MAEYTSPLASSTGGLGFSRLLPEEIRKISAIRIIATPALDSMFGPVPGGLYDPAMGAIQSLDLICTTCKLNWQLCTGHCGHIELPSPCYHPQLIDTTLRLLRAKCVYCHRLRLPSLVINKTICELRLLQYGLVEEYYAFQKIQSGSNRGQQLGEEPVSEDEAVSDLMERRSKFVEKKLNAARRRGYIDPSAFIRNPVAASIRRSTIADFIARASTDRKCAQCHGISPGYRKDRSIKIFRKPLSNKAKETMRIQSMKAPNPLLFLQSQQKHEEIAKKPMANGIHSDDTLMIDVDHGADDEIAAQSAFEEAEANPEFEENEDSQVYMTTDEVYAALTLLFAREQEIFSLLFSSDQKTTITADKFFLRVILVPPNKFRPLARVGQNTLMEAQQNHALNGITHATNELRRAVRDYKSSDDPIIRTRALGRKIALAVALQERVNMLIDQPPNTIGRPSEQGIKQVLEKKEGLFRMNMMGKRVNYAARSVISPDPNIETNEIGIPLIFAKRLTYPEPVTKHNFEELKKAVQNGVEKYPGASAIEDEAGRRVNLRRKTPEQRNALAKQLLTTTVPGAKGDQTKKVYRHLLSGDVVMMNRQPTLHKPSMMGHRAKVLTNQKTIRMHYSNCNTYNADFDGDEMNMHFPQNELARTEALQIADTDNQYLSATAGKPLRGLIQDHISMAVHFTSRDTFFDRDQYQELLYACLRPEDSHTIYERIQLVSPAILKPKVLWTGKQIITSVLKNITPDRYQGINLTSKSSTSSESWGEMTVEDSAKFQVTPDKVVFRDTENVVIFRDGEHLCGTLDKGQIGPSVGGLVHSVYELYGPIIAGKLLSVLGRLLTRFLNERAWTCGMDDLYLTNEGDNHRRAELSESKRVGLEVAAEYVSLKPTKAQQDRKTLISRLENVLRDDDQLNGLDQVYKSKIRLVTDSVSKLCMPVGLRKQFPCNQMQTMTVSGAKGSGVNANLISCNLGQQVLEGRRVPVMVSGKSLPAFQAFDTDPAAGGYVSGRFLTGIKPHEYYFHHMSGREGLIDTAVKTAKSGYLQRCVVKGLEGAKTEYDISVRETSNGSILQFLYGEDGLEVTKQRHIKKFSFLAQNYRTVGVQLKADEILGRVKVHDVSDKQKAVLKAIRRNTDTDIDPILATHAPAAFFGSTSESFALDLAKYFKEDPDRLIKDKKTNPNATLSRRTFQSIMDLKYMRSLVEAGEAVGVVAAQSVGEPSTQMTLNTFHLAGHSAKNVTLGIPRLREIIMTATPHIMTPTMTLHPIKELSVEDGTKFAKSITKLPLAHLIKDLDMTERSDGGSGYERSKVYDIRIYLYDIAEYEEEYAITSNDVLHAFEKKFLPRLDKMIKAEFKKKAKEAERSIATAAVPDLGVSAGRVEEQRAVGQTAEREGGEDDIDEEADPDAAKDAADRGRRDDVYDEPDEEEQRIAEASDQSESEDDENDIARTVNHTPTQPTEDSGYESEELDAADEEAVARQEALKETLPDLAKFHFSRNPGRPSRIVLKYDSKTPKLLLLPILERCARLSLIHSIPGLGICALYMEDVLGNDGQKVRSLNPETGKEEDATQPVITTEGVNLIAMREYQDILDPHNIYTNSVHDMQRSYGIEAARMVIIKEISSVFTGHGISVDNRHINLIADAMTQSGKYLAFSRHGVVKESSSVLAKMSFETVMGFLREAVLFGEKDDLKGVSARIVAGRRGLIGTGGFDVVMPVGR